LPGRELALHEIETDAGTDLALIEAAARAAGAVALSYWKLDPRQWDKGDDAGPVSEADIAVNDLLHRQLIGARPDYGWLSEETADDTARLDCDRVFIIDPIDGTRAFLAGEDSFAISVAVAEQGRVVAGAVFLPAKARMYTATLDGPACLNGQPIAVSSQHDIAAAHVLTQKASLSPDHWPVGLPAFQRHFRPSLAYRLCLAAEGRFDAMLTLRDAWEWDIAAGVLIAERAGAVVTDGFGQALEFNTVARQTAGVIVAPPLLHAAILAARVGGAAPVSPLG
jgi:myo-inositol-1(or 4)-monophosphatase